MNYSSIFTSDFVNAVRAILGDGSVPVTAGMVAERLGCPNDVDIVRACVRVCMPEYESVKGRHGGFRRRATVDSVAA